MDSIGNTAGDCVYFQVHEHGSPAQEARQINVDSSLEEAQQKGQGRGRCKEEVSLTLLSERDYRTLNSSIVFLRQPFTN